MRQAWRGLPTSAHSTPGVSRSASPRASRSMPAAVARGPCLRRLRRIWHAETLDPAASPHRQTRGSSRDLRQRRPVAHHRERTVGTPRPAGLPERASLQSARDSRSLPHWSRRPEPWSPTSATAATASQTRRQRSAASTEIIPGTTQVYQVPPGAGRLRAYCNAFWSVLPRQGHEHQYFVAVVQHGPPAVERRDVAAVYYDPQRQIRVLAPPGPPRRAPASRHPTRPDAQRGRRPWSPRVD